MPTFPTGVAVSDGLVSGRGEVTPPPPPPPPPGGREKTVCLGSQPDGGQPPGGGGPQGHPIGGGPSGRGLGLWAGTVSRRPPFVCDRLVHRNASLQHHYFILFCLVGQISTDGVTLFGGRTRCMQGVRKGRSNKSLCNEGICMKAGQRLVWTLNRVENRVVG